MPCDEAGIPTKPKMSLLTVASDKARGILGKADLDLSQFNYDDYRILRLEVRECQYEGAWVEVGLKAVPTTGSSRNNNLLNSSYRSSASQVSMRTNTQESAAAESNPNMTEQHYQELLNQFTD